MSTRATYQFSDGARQWTVKTTIYVHYDGYLSGAAYYFYQMLTNPSKGCAATQFIRAVDQAEITRGHDAHGDTAFKYDLEGHGPDATLTARHVSKWEADDRQWGLSYIGQLAEFIDANHEMIENYSPFRAVKLPYERVVWLNDVTAKQRLEGEHGPLSHLRIWDKGVYSDRKSANWKSCAEEARLLIEAFPALRTDESDYLLNDKPQETAREQQTA